VFEKIKESRRVQHGNVVGLATLINIKTVKKVTLVQFESCKENPPETLKMSKSKKSTGKR
jgi:hypothetical protein